MDYHDTMTALDTLKQYHPLFVEGMGSYDPRDPDNVAETVVASISAHWERYPPNKPPILIIQGDPLAPKGISAITPRVAQALGLRRGLIVLNEDIADYHSPNADRDNVIVETRYSEVVSELEQARPGRLAELENAIDRHLAEKNQQRLSLDKRPLADYYPIFARLQEVSKACLADLCGEMTLAHTSADIDSFSVTSFYQVSLDLGCVPAESVVAFRADLSPGLSR